MFIKFSSYRTFVNYCILKSNTYVFFRHFLGAFSKFVSKRRFLYILSYLIDKKEYRKEKNFEERIAGLKSICIFVAEK